MKMKSFEVDRAIDNEIWRGVYQLHLCYQEFLSLGMKTLQDYHHENEIGPNDYLEDLSL